MRGWLAAGNLNIECLGDIEVRKSGCVFYDHTLNKFPGDRASFQTEQTDVFLDGFVYNRQDFTDHGQNWSQVFAEEAGQNMKSLLNRMRGGFCGYAYGGRRKELRIFTDQVGNKAVYYYSNMDKWMVSNHLDYMVRVLRENHEKYSFCAKAAEYMLSYGYMIDDSTFIEQIHRVLPGEYVIIKDGHIQAERYYMIPNAEQQMSEDEAIEKIDYAFREAVRREFEKDREYGYRHLVDLSGGLDSRMVSFVGHDLGYTDQVNITYSQAGYSDDVISKEIALYLKHEYLFKPLDDAGWMRDIDSITSQNNGAALFLGITGGARMLGTLNTEQFGMEHTGMIGDAILSTFYHDRTLNYGAPRFGYHRYSDRLAFDFEETLLGEYPCQELFAIYTRGMLGAQSSYITRQHYVETDSPFMDVDFLNTVFSLPFEYRNRHHIYLKWMLQKYPDATKFGWEKWGGVRPREDHIWRRKIRTIRRLMGMKVSKLVGKSSRDGMTPVDYWYCRDMQTVNLYEKYYDENVENPVITDNLRKDIEVMFKQGNVMEKSMALTVLAEMKKYFSDQEI